ncbi:MAG: flavodoxin family protein [Candidatus Thorarchaeota archaeon]|nr:flavodoxin family protein [Candidatus Thorarchaeota archaeon]
MKKVLVVFDSSYGNTEKLAREIAAGITDTGKADCTVIGVSEVSSHDFTAFDGVLLGGPIHMFRAARGLRGAVTNAINAGLAGKLVGAFETYQSPGHAGRAVKYVEEEIAEKVPNARLFTPGLASLVDGRKGPLNAAEPAKAREFGQRFAAELGD